MRPFNKEYDNCVTPGAFYKQPGARAGNVTDSPKSDFGGDVASNHTDGKQMGSARFSDPSSNSADARDGLELPVVVDYIRLQYRL